MQQLVAWARDAWPYLFTVAVDRQRGMGDRGCRAAQAARARGGGLDRAGVARADHRRAGLLPAWHQSHPSPGHGARASRRRGPGRQREPCVARGERHLRVRSTPRGFRRAGAARRARDPPAAVRGQSHRATGGWRRRLSGDAGGDRCGAALDRHGELHLRQRLRRARVPRRAGARGGARRRGARADRRRRSALHDSDHGGRAAPRRRAGGHVPADAGAAPVPVREPAQSPQDHGRGRAPSASPAA